MHEDFKLDNNLKLINLQYYGLSFYNYDLSLHPLPNIIPQDMYFLNAEDIFYILILHFTKSYAIVPVFDESSIIGQTNIDDIVNTLRRKGFVEI